ncbi:MAG: hypothetical protein IIC13_17000, partial [SAR324 cluster bacterium]|nr:hypothetical protein [SAR324 cluster bacterium]
FLAFGAFLAFAAFLAFGAFLAFAAFLAFGGFLAFGAFLRLGVLRSRFGRWRWGFGHLILGGFSLSGIFHGLIRISLSEFGAWGRSALEPLLTCWNKMNE